MRGGELGHGLVGGNVFLILESTELQMLGSSHLFLKLNVGKSCNLIFVLVELVFDSLSLELPGLLPVLDHKFGARFEKMDSLSAFLYGAR
jgi:hypothetical protein